MREKETLKEPADNSKTNVRRLPFPILAILGVSLVICLALATHSIGHHVISGYFVALIRQCDGIVRHGVRDLKEQPTLWKLFALFFTSFAYGIIHSAGPGHGKAIVTAYFLRNSQTPSRAFTMAGVISTVHTLGAIGISLLFLVFLKEAGVFFKMKVQGYLMGLSGIAVLSIGLVMMANKLLRANKKEDANASGILDANPFLLGAAAGIVPCPVAMFLITFSIAQGIPFVGLLSVLGISLGMFTLLSLIGFLVLKGRDNLFSGSKGKFRGIERFAVALEYASFALIILIGGGMAAAAFI